MEKYCPKCSQKRNSRSHFCDICGTPLEEREGRIKLPPGMKEKVFRNDGYRCRMCGASKEDGIELTIDHIIPLAAGGTNDLDNLQTLCRECNENKANLILPSGLEIDIETKQNELKLLNNLLEQEESKLSNNLDPDEKIDILFNIKQLKEKQIPLVESELKELNNQFNVEQRKLNEEKQEKEKREKLFKKLYVYLDDSTLHILKRYFSIDEESKENILRVLVEEHDEKEINNAIFEKFNNDLNDNQRYWVCYRFNNSKKDFVDFLMKTGLSKDKLLNELKSSRGKLFNELNRNLNYRQKYLLKMYFSLGDCTDADLITHLINSQYTEKKLLQLIKSYQHQLYDELDSKLSKKHLKLIKIHYSITDYSKSQTINFLFDKNIFTIGEVVEIIEDSLINDLVKNLNINDTSLLRYKYSHLRSNEELYSFLMRKGYSIEYIHDLIKEIKEELYVELKNELDYQKVYKLSRMLNLPNSKEKVINYLIENYTVEGINRLTNILNR